MTALVSSHYALQNRSGNTKAVSWDFAEVQNKFKILIGSSIISTQKQNNSFLDSVKWLKKLDFSFCWSSGRPD